MEIHFTKHAREKFRMLARHGVRISKKDVVETLKKFFMRGENRNINHFFLKGEFLESGLFSPPSFFKRKSWAPKMKNNSIKIAYDPEADVLSWEIAKKAKTDYASEMENIIVHFTKNHVPVFI